MSELPAREWFEHSGLDWRTEVGELCRVIPQAKIAPLPEEVIFELIRCRNDFKYESEKYSQIQDRDTGRWGPWVWNSIQRKAYERFRRKPDIIALKPRKVGLTTEFSAYADWRMRWYGWRVGAVAHHRDTMKHILTEMYGGAIQRRNPFFTDLFPIDNFNRRSGYKYANGGGLRISTAGSVEAHGETFHLLLADEYGYWEQPFEANQAIFGAAADGAEMATFSTAHGHNHFRDLWFGADNSERLFFSWLDDDGYSSAEMQYGGEIDRSLYEYAERHGIEGERFNWLVDTFYSQKVRASWNDFNQMFPISPEVAFVSSGQRFFPKVFTNTKEVTGFRHVLQPVKERVYAMGADTASGSKNGDFSAAVVLDVTEALSSGVETWNRKVHLAARFYDRIPPHEFAEVVARLATEYDALLCLELDAYGSSVLKRLRDSDKKIRYYVDQIPDSMGSGLTERLGVPASARIRGETTSRLLEYVSRDWLEMDDPTFGHEANTFVVEKDRPDHLPNKHSDLLIATALALLAIDQCVAVANEKIKRRPLTFEELCRWEAAHGMSYDEFLILNGEHPTQTVLDPFRSPRYESNQALV